MLSSVVELCEPELHGFAPLHSGCGFLLSSHRRLTHRRVSALESNSAASIWVLLPMLLRRPSHAMRYHPPRDG